MLAALIDELNPHDPTGDGLSPLFKSQLQNLLDDMNSYFGCV
jgi:hypothetical protein